MEPIVATSTESTRTATSWREIVVARDALLLIFRAACSRRYCLFNLISAKTKIGVITMITQAPSVNFTTAKIRIITAETRPDSQLTITL